jgi:nucleoside-diphosphate-sugar epimerase
MTAAKAEPSSRVLLTGSEGAIGPHVGQALRADGYAVRGLDLRPAVPSEREHCNSDLLDLAAVRQAMEGVTAVVHAGGIPWDRGEGADILATNVLGTWNVLQAAVEAGVERVISLSSINAQGSTGGWRDPEYLPIDDAYPHHPMTPYQLSKHLMEETCRSFSERHGLATICLRPVFVAHPASQHLPGFGTEAFVAAWRDEYWAYVDVRDVAEAVVRALRLEGVLHDRFLLAARDTSVVPETPALVEREYPRVPWPSVDPEGYFAGQPHRSLIDCHHAHEVLGWEPRHSWRDTSAPDTPGR